MEAATLLVAIGAVNALLVDHLEFDGRLMWRLAGRLVADAQVMTIRALARRYGVAWSVINKLVRAWSGLIC